MMHALVALLFFFGPPFWEAKPAEKWSNQQIELLLSNSPWAQGAGPSPAVLVYLATAKPIQEAEAELRVRGTKPLHEPDPDYAEHITSHHDEHLVLAIPYTNLAKLGKEEEHRRMEQESVMLIGRSKRYKIAGYFPPTPSDPVLRLVFPREVQKTDKTVTFRLYLPGIDFPEREIEFPVKDLMYHGKLEM